MITAAVCTRNRGASAAGTVRSLLANDHPEFEVLVVDQSTGPETRAALAPLLSDSRLRYFRTQTVGVSRSRNEAMRLASPASEIICYTDDDCTVPQDWLRTMERLFQEHPHAALVFCNTRAADHDRTAGFIPAYVRTGTVELQSALDKCRNRAMGAGMAVRRSLMLEMEGFDEALGPGGRFQCCEEGDLAVRTLLAGYRV
jgi:glycosyltransferase involved in cell wall biosynthesis